MCFVPTKLSLFAPLGMPYMDVLCFIFKCMYMIRWLIYAEVKFTVCRCRIMMGEGVWKNNNYVDEL